MIRKGCLNILAFLGIVVLRRWETSTHSRTHGFSLFILLFSKGSYLKISSCGSISLMSFVSENVLNGMLDEPAMAAAARDAFPPLESKYQRPRYSLRIWSPCEPLPIPGPSRPTQCKRSVIVTQTVDMLDVVNVPLLSLASARSTAAP